LVPTLMKYFVAKTLLDSTNSTLNGTYGSCKISSMYIRETGKDLWDDKNPAGRKYVWSGSDTFSFLTCHAKSRMVDFNTYVVPFDRFIWIGIFVSALAMVGFTGGAMRVQRIRSTDQLAPMIFLFTSLLNLSYAIPNAMLKKTWFRIIMISWLLAAIVLTNLYTSLAISGVIKPLPEKSISRFDELTTKRHVQESKIRFELLSDIINDESSEYQENLFQTFSTPIDEESGNIKKWKDLKFGRQLRDSMLFDYVKNVNSDVYDIPLSQFQIAMLPLLNRETKMYAPDKLTEILSESKLLDVLTRIEREIVRCEGKVYVDPTQSVLAEHQYLSQQYDWKEFKTSEERVLWHQYFMVFDAEFNSKMPTYYGRLQAAGIIDKWKKDFRETLYRKRIRSTKFFTKKERPDLPEPVKLSGNFQTVFYVYGALVGVCLLAFCLEMAGPVSRKTALIYDRWIVQGYLRDNLWQGFDKFLWALYYVWIYSYRALLLLTHRINRQFF
jgi:hypothetical protein